MAYPHEYFTQSAFSNLDNFQEPLSLTKENCWTTLKQETPPNEEINRTHGINKKFNTMNGEEITMVNLKMDVLHLADDFENFAQTSTEGYGINPLNSYQAPGYTWKAGLKMTKIKVDFIKDKELVLLLFENNIRGVISSVMCDRHVVSDVNKQILYIDAHNLYGWAMSQILPTGEFQRLPFFSK